MLKDDPDADRRAGNSGGTGAEKKAPRVDLDCSKLLTLVRFKLKKAGGNLPERICVAVESHGRRWGKRITKFSSW